MTATTPVRWQVIPQVELHWKYWDGEYVVFNAASGHTHLMDALAVQVLSEILKAPCDADELLERTARALDVHPNEALGGMLGQMLDQLEKLDLIEALED